MSDMDDSGPYVELNRDELGIYTVTLNRPDRINAINLAMRDELWQIFLLLRDDPTAKCAILRGAGSKGFSAGADISEFGSSPSLYESREARLNRDLWELMAKLDIPLISALHGFTYGAGLEMSLYCDLRVASEDSLFALPEVTLGYIPSAGGTQTISRHLRSSDAALMAISGLPISAENACQKGLVHQVVSKEELDGVAIGWARQLAAYDPDVVRALKRTLREGFDLPLDTAVLAEKIQSLNIVTRTQ
tara:strand:- start:2023 stop:2766 length:744 start_codon:yes stop_codon:yes gene_type:complete